jgi:hypothetical protein
MKRYSNHLHTMLLFHDLQTVRNWAHHDNINVLPYGMINRGEVFIVLESVGSFRRVLSANNAGWIYLSSMSIDCFEVKKP